MRKRIVAFGLIAALSLGYALWGTAQDVPSAVRVLGLFEVGVALADVTSSYDVPLVDRSPEPGLEPYDLIVILPRGIDNGSARQIWVVSAGRSELASVVAASLNVLTGIVDQVFAGIGEAVDVSEDLWPCLLWAVYSTRGWIR
jgi:hypothetical protein